MAAKLQTLKIEDQTMRTYQLLTYHLRTPEATKAYGTALANHIGSLRHYGIESHGIFSSPSRHNTVMILVSYLSRPEPGFTAKEYFSSVNFRNDIGPFDFDQIIRGDDILLNPFSVSVDSKAVHYKSA
jgi:hypothetical protein